MAGKFVMYGKAGGGTMYISAQVNLQQPEMSTFMSHSLLSTRLPLVLSVSSSLTIL
jgi:hypothetical protein